MTVPRSPNAIDLDQATAIFAEFAASEDLALRFPADGCYARTHPSARLRKPTAALLLSSRGEGEDVSLSVTPTIRPTCCWHGAVKSVSILSVSGSAREK